MNKINQRNLSECETCGNTIARDAKKCPSCGHDLREQKNREEKYSFSAPQKVGHALQIPGFILSLFVPLLMIASTAAGIVFAVIPLVLSTVGCGLGKKRGLGIAGICLSLFLPVLAGLIALSFSPL